jgi:hypothetical protein
MRTCQEEMEIENEREGKLQLVTEHPSYSPFPRRWIVDPFRSEEPQISGGRDGSPGWQGLARSSGSTDSPPARASWLWSRLDWGREFSRPAKQREIML